MSQIDGSLVQIDTKFHDDSVIHPGFICLACSNMTWILHFTSSSHGISMVFAKKMMGFPSDLVSLSNQTKLPAKGHEKIHECHFFTG